MKLSAFLLFFIWSLLLVQPVFSYFGGLPSYTFCKMQESSGSGCGNEKQTSSSCTKDQEQRSCGEKGSNDDGTGNCNPSLGCSSGNFYLFVNSHLIIEIFPLTIQKLVLSNDNRIAEQLSECWHPPEILS